MAVWAISALLEELSLTDSHSLLKCVHEPNIGCDIVPKFIIDLRKERVALSPWYNCINQSARQLQAGGDDSRPSFSTVLEVTCKNSASAPKGSSSILFWRVVGGGVARLLSSTGPGLPL